MARQGSRSGGRGGSAQRGRQGEASRSRQGGAARQGGRRQAQAGRGGRGEAMSRQAGRKGGSSRTSGRSKPAPTSITSYLKGIDFPVSKDDLLDHAQQQGAPEEVLEVIRQLPEREYNSPVEVTEGAGELI